MHVRSRVSYLRTYTGPYHFTEVARNKSHADDITRKLSSVDDENSAELSDVF